MSWYRYMSSQHSFGCRFWWRCEMSAEFLCFFKRPEPLAHINSTSILQYICRLYLLALIHLETSRTSMISPWNHFIIDLTIVWCESLPWSLLKLSEPLSVRIEWVINSLYKTQQMAFVCNHKEFKVLVKQNCSTFPKIQICNCGWDSVHFRSFYNNIERLIWRFVFSVVFWILLQLPTTQTRFSHYYLTDIRRVTQ